MAELQAQVTAVVNQVTRCIYSATNLILNSSMSRLACFPDSPMPFTDCILLWGDGGCRHEFTTHVFELLSELALEVSSSVLNQPSRYAKGSNPVFEEVIPDDLRILAGNHGNDTKNARKVENVHGAQLVSGGVCKHEQICGCCVTKLSVCMQMWSRMMLTLAHVALPPVTRVALACAWFEGWPKVVRMWRRHAVSLRSSPAVSSGSRWSLVLARTRVAGNAWAESAQPYSDSSQIF